MTTDPLARVKRAAETKRRAENEYRAALEHAHGAGASFASIGRAAGVTRQAITKQLRPRPS